MLNERPRQVLVGVDARRDLAAKVRAGLIGVGRLHQLPLSGGPSTSPRLAGRLTSGGAELVALIR